MTAPRGNSGFALRGGELIPHAAAPLSREIPRWNISPAWQSSATPEPKIPWWSIVACMVSIVLIRRSLAWFGFARTLKRVRDRSERTRAAAGDFSPASIEKADRVVAMAAALYPGRALCLERSLVLYERLRREGAAVELRIGVQATPFAAHAWVTYGGEPVNDSAEHVSHFVVIPALPS